MANKIVGVKNPILREKAKPVTKIDKKIVDLVHEMEKILIAQKDPEGVGLAAPQIGKSLRMFVVNYKKLKRVIINPEVIEISKAKPGKSHSAKASGKEILEGCLSLPHYYGPIVRAGGIKIKYQTIEMINNKWQTVNKTENFTGFNAQIIAHEIDHLNGVLFIDKILEQKAPLYKFDGDEWEEVELV